jgi:DNA helicase IV
MNLRAQMTSAQCNVTVHISNQQPVMENYFSSRWVDRAPPEICAISPVVTITEHDEKPRKIDAFQTLTKKSQKTSGSTSTERVLTAEQNAVIQAVVNGHGSLFVSACAGSGKTSTIEESIRVLKREQPDTTFAYTCFCRANVDEAVKRLKGIIKVKENEKSKQVATLNSRGFAALRSTYGVSATDPEKYKEDTISTLFAHGYMPYHGLLTDEQAKKLVGEREFEKVKGKCKSIIDATVRGEPCSYDEQVLLPALMPDMKFGEPVDILFIDECQDLSEVNMRLVARMSPKRVIAVGDRRQAIYGFRGAHYQAVDEMISRFSMTEMKLSISFRCPSAIADHAGGMTGSKEGGVVRDGVADEIRPGDAVLCRFNAPLDDLACDLLERGYIVSTKRIEEAIAKPLVGTPCSKLKATHPSLKKTFAMHKTVGELKKAIQSRECIKLMTIHKSKGLEFNRVNIIRDGLYGDDPQADNLVYVARTRAMSELIYI